jgi:membrane-associated phospholipid phosphatase
MTTLAHILLKQLESGDVVLAAVLALFAVWLGVEALHLLGPLAGRHARWFRQFAWQVGGLLGLEQLYEYTRGQIPHDEDVAYLHAYRLLGFEWGHGFFFEQRVERFFSQFHTLMNAIDLFYILSHLGVTIVALVWIYAAHRRHYPFVRNLIMLTTAIALVVFYLYPTAPPRLLGQYGFIDPAQAHNLVSAGGAQLGSYTYNPYAAMPSLHVAYALVVSWGTLVATRKKLLRAQAAAYPFMMAAAVIISGNHWLLDVLGATVTVALAASCLWLAGLTRAAAGRWLAGRAAPLVLRSGEAR